MEESTGVSPSGDKGLYSTMIQDIKISTPIKREELHELGRRAPYYRYVTFPHQEANRGFLYFLSGISRSGKTTFANKWVRGPFSFSNNENAPASFNYISDEIEIHHPRVIISGDDFRTALHGKNYVPEAESTVFAMMDVATKALLNRGFDVLIDETCTTEATLLRYLRIDRGARPIWMDTPATVCKERAAASGKDYLNGVIDRLHFQFTIFKRDYETIRARLLDYLDSRKEQDVTV